MTNTFHIVTPPKRGCITNPTMLGNLAGCLIGVWLIIAILAILTVAGYAAIAAILGTV